MAVGPYRITVVYRAGLDLDEQIRKLAGKRDWASGCGFGERDIGFDFKTAARRDQAFKRLQASGLPITTTAHDAAPEE